MKEFSNRWKSSSKKSKQVKYRANAPLHIKRKFVRSHLSKELKQKYGKRSMGVRVGDKVKIVRGQFKKKEGRVEEILLKDAKLYISGAEAIKKDGGKRFYPVDPSNVIITTLVLEDKKREAILNRTGEKKAKADVKAEKEKK